MVKTLDLKEVKNKFELYKLAFNKNPHVKELAKELGVKTTTLMEFIQVNTLHFRLYNGNKGCFINEVYSELKDAPGTDEFVEYNKEKYKNTLFLDTYSYPYTDDVAFHRIIEDNKDSERSNEWRNTPDKFQKVKDFISNNRVSIGMKLYRFNDYISKENIELLILQGWEFINYHKNSEK